MIEHCPCVREIVDLNPGRVKPMAYQIDTFHFLARCSALLGEGNDWLTQYQDNVTEWGIGSWC